jgi:hypothetical protein
MECKSSTGQRPGNGHGARVTQQSSPQHQFILPQMEF